MKIVLMKLIDVYKKWISPLFPRKCRFYPTCSQYTYDAINKYGVVKGIIKSIIRIIKCNPFHPGGYDPV